MLVIGIHCWTSSNFGKLTTPYDAEGKGCGIDHPDYPFIYFVAPDYDVLHTHNTDSLENSMRENMSKW